MVAQLGVASVATAWFAAAASTSVTLTPWCENSMRVRIAPASMPPSTAAAQAALQKTLAEKNMTDLAGALIDKCGPGAPVYPRSGDVPTVQGNLAAALNADGTLSFSRKDTGAVLFLAKASFTENGLGTEATWQTVPDKALTCSSSQFVEDIGTKDTAAACLADATNVYHGPQINYVLWTGGSDKQCYMCALSGDPGSWPLVDSVGAVSFTGPPLLPINRGYLSGNLTISAGNTNEVIYGLGQGEWTDEGGCPAEGMNGARIVPLERNGQTINLMQRKFHVSIPFVYSTGGYGFLFNMPGYGSVTIGDHGVGGAQWSAEAALYLDFWVSALPPSAAVQEGGSAIFKQYADATGHAPAMREEALLFWQSRNRYKSSDIALSIAQHYQKLALPIGVLVIDYKNQLVDGDFLPNPACYPSVQALTDGVRAAINATTMFSFWPEVQPASSEYDILNKRGCLINSDLDGLAIDATIPQCRDYIWSNMLKPRYYDQGVDSYWLDETDAEGTGGGPDGNFGYHTSYGVPVAYSNLWVNDWISMYSDPVVAANAAKGSAQPPLVLTRGAWAGGQRYGIVLWSSDIRSTFEQLASQVPQGVHASMSGIPWWTTDVGGYGCGSAPPIDQPYMQELIVRWYQFGLFCPVFRTHGCRDGPSEPDSAACQNVHGSCGFNEVWSYGNETQKILEKYVIFRATELKPYIAELAKNVTSSGVPTMRPLAFEFPLDPGCRGIDDQYMLGPMLLVAPVTVQRATARSVYFPAGASWEHLFTKQVMQGGQRVTVDAPLDIIPVYRRK